MNYKLTLLIIISVILSGCMYGSEQPKNITESDRYIKVKYVEKDNIIKTEDFPDFKLIHNIYYVTSENVSLTLQTEIGHGTYVINKSDDVPQGYRLYGGSEAYNSSERYLLLQYKVFDDNEDLNDVISMTIEDYIQKGFEFRSLDNASRGDVFILESNVTNRTDMNITIILFGFDTVIGKIGVQDYKNKSLDESLKILDIVYDRLNVNIKEVKAEIFTNNKIQA